MEANRIETLAVDAALGLAGERTWSEVTLGDIAARAGLSLARLYGVLPSTSAVVDAFWRRVDVEMLNYVEDLDTEDNELDKLFDTIMARFEALESYRPAVRSIYDGLRRDPLSWLALRRSFWRSMNALIDASGLSTEPSHRLLGSRLIVWVWLRTFSVWLDDDPRELAKTMAAVNAELRRLQRLTSFCRGTTAATLPSSESTA